ncbi:MAG: sigma-70 family RNA polymerase sigma factor [Chromatiales bacterium]
MNTIALSQSRSQVREQNHELFAALIEQYTEDCFRYAYWLAGNREVAEDLVQETLIRAWKSVHKLQDVNAIKGWLFTIVRRENARRFERKQAPQSQMPVEEVSAPAQSYDTSTEAFVLRQAIAGLPQEYREPLLLQVLHGYSQKEIAAHLGISSAGAGTRLFRARQKLKEVLGEG